MQLVRLRGLSWAPPGGPPLFEGLDLDIADRVVLVGPSGSGKSTLLRCASLLQPLLAGTILWHGAAVGAHNVRSYRNQVVYLTQQPAAVAPTVEEDLAFARETTHALGRPPLEPAEQRDLLERLGLGGLDWRRRFGVLSVGEQQRVALVRALTPRPAVLLLDEPTAALDPRSTEAVEALLDEHLAQPEHAQVWVSHHPDQVARLGGRRLEMGSLLP